MFCFWKGFIFCLVIDVVFGDVVFVIFGAKDCYNSSIDRVTHAQVKSLGGQQNRDVT